MITRTHAVGLALTTATTLHKSLITTQPEREREGGAKKSESEKEVGKRAAKTSKQMNERIR